MSGARACVTFSDMDHGAAISLPGFRDLLRGFGITDLERSENSVYGLLPDLTLAYLNPGWFRFAADNGGGRAIREDWNLGSNVLDAMSGSPRTFYEKGFKACMDQRSPWSHDYDCSSPEQYRRFHMDVYPLARHGLLVIHTLVIEVHHSTASRIAPGMGDRYVRNDGLIAQCAYCRRTRRNGVSAQWDWVPRWVDDPPGNVTGSLCKPCFRMHFPSAEAPA